MYKIFVIGISEQVLTSKQQQMLSRCALLVATGRLADIAANFTGQVHPVAPLDKAIAAIGSNLATGNVAVLASGDPLFYGIGKKLLSEFDSQQLEFHPGLSAVQRGCALLKTPWDDAMIVSLHGREHHHIPGLMLQHEKTIAFTDQKNSPRIIAEKIFSYLQSIGDNTLIDKITLSVAEEIGLENENTSSGSLEDTRKRSFSPLNILCLQRPSRPDNKADFGLGLGESDICHSRGLITKSEVRAATLHRLQLPRKGIFWDIGGGSGSISIEAARANPGLTIYTVEHKNEELQNIKENIRRFGCFNVIPVPGRAPEVLVKLPSPDRAFIGGSSGALADIIALLDKRMGADCRLVINGVIEKTIQSAPRLMRDSNFSVTSTAVAVTRTSENGTIERFNPITIMTGIR